MPPALPPGGRHGSFGRAGSRCHLPAAARGSAHRTFGGWLRELRNEEHGLLLDPQLDVDGDLLGVRLPRGASRAFPPGRGFLVRRGTIEVVQVAM